MQIVAESLLPPLHLEPCRPPWWAPHGHWQTIAGHLLPSPLLPDPGQRLEIELPDGDRLVSFFHEGPSDIVVSLYHGLSGDIHSDYMRRTALLCQTMGITCVRVNHRGAGEGAGLARHPYHSGRGDDIAVVLKKLRSRFPGKKQIAIGFSMSGNILLYLLAGRGLDERPDAAITVNAAIDLANAARHLRRGVNRVYDRRFVHLLGEDLRKRQARGEVSMEVRLPRGASVYDFDEVYTARAGGFRDRDHYYESCSTKQYVNAIEVPTYVLTAQDDPFVRVEDYLEARWSPKVSLHIEKCGGHLGYWSARKTPWDSHRWLDYYLHEALTALGADPQSS